MELVDSVLAFALIMAALASLVTLLMEVFHRVLRLRAKGMEALLSQYYDEVLFKKLDLSNINKQDVMDGVLINPARKIILDSSFRIFPNWLIEKLMCYTEVSPDDLLKRINQTKAFNELKGKTEAEIRKTLGSIEAQYDEYSAAMSDYFKRRAKLFSLLVGILLAFAANIDGLRIYEALKVSPEIRASIISLHTSLEKSYELAQKNLDVVDSSRNPASEDNQKQIEAIKKNLEAAAEVSKLSSMGLPIGWAYFPAKLDEDKLLINHLCELVDRIKSKPFDHLIWFLTVLITGLLIGLGAPFWFEVARKLTQFKQAVGGKEATAPMNDNRVNPTDNKTTIDKIVERG